ncbi:MAG: FAD:protein FMN transferase [Candidatus Hydrogenedentes bacterium]|nr:FAD:protein FMN transferase [Candidatus Hydrogenedentota bacterium]
MYSNPCAFFVGVLLSMPLVASRAVEPLVVSHEAMGTEFEFRLYPSEGVDAESLPDLARMVFDAIDDLESRISSWNPDSQTAYLNSTAASRSVRVSNDLFQLIRVSAEIYEETHGAFDPTVGPLMELWALRTGHPQQPTSAAIDEARTHVGMNHIELDTASNAVRFRVQGIQLDFGGIGKGLALDQARDTLIGHGIVSALLSAGTSTVVAIGAPPGKTGWTVHVRHPYNSGQQLATVVLSDESLSTSACHALPCDILDPRTGMPVTANHSATAITESATRADALSTAFLVMGVEATRAYCARRPGVRAFIASGPIGKTLRVDHIPDSTKIGDSNDRPE